MTKEKQSIFNPALAKDTVKRVNEIDKVFREVIVTDKKRIRPKNSEVVRLLCDNTKLISNTNWKPKYNFDDALKETVNWYLKNTQWWEPLIDESVLHPQPWTLNWSK